MFFYLHWKKSSICHFSKKMKDECLPKWVVNGLGGGQCFFKRQPLQFQQIQTQNRAAHLSQKLECWCLRLAGMMFSIKHIIQFILFDHQVQNACHNKCKDIQEHTVEVKNTMAQFKKKFANLNCNTCEYITWGWKHKNVALIMNIEKWKGQWWFHPIADSLWSACCPFQAHPHVCIVINIMFNWTSNFIVCNTKKWSEKRNIIIRELMNSDHNFAYTEKKSHLKK